MSIEDISEQIEKKKKECLQPYSKDSGYDRIKNFLQNNCCTKIEHFMDIDIWECISCLYYLKMKDRKSMKECFDFFDGFKACFENLSYSDITKVIHMLSIIRNSREKEKLLSYFTGKSSLPSIRFLELIHEFGVEVGEETNEEKLEEDFRRIMKLIKELNSKGNLLSLISISYYEEGLIEDLFDYYSTQVKMQYDRVLLEDELARHSFLPTKEKERISSDFYRKLFDSSAILDEYNILSQFVHDEDRNEKNHRRDKQRISCNYDRALEILIRDSNHEEITKTREILHYVSDDETKRMIISFIAEHNDKYYERLEQELMDLRSHSINLYHAILSRHHISIHPKYISEIEHHSLEDLEQILSLLPISSFTDVEVLYLLKSTTLEIVQRIKKYMDLGYFSLDFLKKNMDFFSQDSSLLHSFEDSILLLQNHNLNPKIFSNSPMLLAYSDIFQKNILLLEEYDLLKSLKTTGNYQFLIKENLSIMIDRLLELGFEKYLEEDLNLLNYDFSKIKRLELLQAMGNMPSSKEDVLMILDSPRFFVSDEDIDSYLLDVSSYMTDEIPQNIEINSFREGKRVLSFNGVFISYPKVVRLLHQGYSLKDAITYEKNFSVEDYQQFLQSFISDDDKNDVLTL